MGPLNFELECSCCGNLAFEGGYPEDGQELLCGCEGFISFCSETSPEVILTAEYEDGDICPGCEKTDKLYRVQK